MMKIQTLCAILVGMHLTLFCFEQEKLTIADERKLGFLVDQSRVLGIPSDAYEDSASYGFQNLYLDDLILFPLRGSVSAGLAL